MPDGLPRDPFDRAALSRNAERARRMAREKADFLLEHAANDLADRLDAVERSFTSAVLLDPPTDGVAPIVSGARSVEGLAAARTEATGRVPLEPAAHDLIVSVMALHTVADVPGTLAQIARALAPDGLFVAVFPGGETLRELRAAFLSAEGEVTGGASPRVFPFIDVRDAGALLQRAGLALPVADVDRLTVRYDTPLDLMADLRAMGMANALAERSRRFLPRAVLGRMLETYMRDHTDPDGRIRATHDLVSVAGWKPHESQQKPLAPGSAKASLAAALTGEGGAKD